MARKRFSTGVYLSFQEARNAIRAHHLNVMLDEGVRVFGDDGPDEEGTWHEIEEATLPRPDGIQVTTKDGKSITIYATRTAPADASSRPASS